MRGQDLEYEKITEDILNFLEKNGCATLSYLAKKFWISKQTILRRLSKFKRIKILDVVFREDSTLKVVCLKDHYD